MKSGKPCLCIQGKSLRIWAVLWVAGEMFYMCLLASCDDAMSISNHCLLAISRSRDC
jgi:hypothetical protein